MRLALVTLALWSLSHALWAQPSAAELTRQTLARAGAPYRWIAEGRVRGAYYSGLADPALYDPAAAAGMNCVLNKYPAYNPDQADAALAFHVAQAEACAQRGLKYIAKINFNAFTERDYTRRQYTPLVDAKGQAYPDTPSPLDREFWNQSIKRRWLQLAEQGRTAPIAGTSIDFEMYGSEIVFYDRVGCLDYSDVAFQGFLRDQKLTLAQPVPPAERAAWIKGKDLAAVYDAYYRRTLEGICRDIEQAVHAAHPDFIIGFYSWGYGSQFYEACARGFGTPERPVLLWPGTTYTDGYSPRQVDDQVILLDKIGAHAVFIPGLWLWQFEAQNLAAHAYLSGAHAGGYWLYGIYSLWEDTARRRKVPHMDAPTYWAALKQANDDLLALQKDPNFQSALKVDPTRTLYIAIDPTLLAAPVTLQPLAATPPPGVPVSDQPRGAPVRGNGVYRAWGVAASTITFRVHSLRLGGQTNGTVANVLGPDQKVLIEERVPVGETKALTVTCPATGVYAVVTQAGNLCAAVASDAPAFVFDASAGLHLMTAVEPALYFLVPTGVKEFTFTGTGQGIERFNARILAPDGTTAAERENISAETPLTVTVPAGQDGKVWQVALARPTEGVLEDVTISLSKNLPPYFAREPERLLTPRQ